MLSVKQAIADASMTESTYERQKKIYSAVTGQCTRECTCG